MVGPRADLLAEGLGQTYNPGVRYHSYGITVTIVAHTYAGGHNKPAPPPKQYRQVGDIAIESRLVTHLIALRGVLRWWLRCHLL